MARLKVCVVTGTRAEYGLLSGLMQELQADPAFELQVIATGMHLSPEFGGTYRIIEQDGFQIDEKVEMLLSSDTPIGTAKSLGLAVIGFADALSRLRSDLLVVLGDRYEILAAVQAALILKLPVAHIAGGDTTEGAFDEAIRHAITKMSHLHFVTNEQAAERVRQLGENPAHVFMVGSPGIDQIKRMKLLDRPALEDALGFTLRDRNLLITFHPVTLASQSSETQFCELLAALDLLGSDVGLIFTKPNADPSGKTLGQMIDDYVATRPNAVSHVSLGQLRYLSAVAHVSAVVGNSSSGLYEVPSFKKPTVNIGDRQRGRLQASSVINCEPNVSAIYKATEQAFRLDCSEVSNPYGDGDAISRIVAVLKQLQEPRQLLMKRFFSVGG